MATYEELFSIRSDSDFRNRVFVAVIIAAETVRNELDTVPNHANRLVWAIQAFSSPGDSTEKMMMMLLAANKDASLGAITGASDAVLQSAVDGAVDLFATG